MLYCLSLVEHEPPIRAHQQRRRRLRVFFDATQLPPRAAARAGAGAATAAAAAAAAAEHALVVHLLLQHAVRGEHHTSPIDRFDELRGRCDVMSTRGSGAGALAQLAKAWVH